MGVGFNVGAGVISSPDEIQGMAGGAGQILSGQNNAEILFDGNIGTNAQVFGAAQFLPSGPCLFDNGLCINVNDHTQNSSSLHSDQVVGSVEESCSRSEAGICVSASILWGEVDGSSRSPVISQKPRQYFKKKSRELCRKLDRRQTCDCKRSSFDYGQYHHQTTNTDEATPPVASSLPNQGPSPTKAEVKRINQRLLDKNLRLIKDFHKTHHHL